MIGTKLGPYEITAKLGEGGMGEVYRATDSRLGREVAIKVLPESVAQNPERLARFEREAKILASLNHNNIATIHGIEEGGSAPALVMELVEGPTLADRLAQGPIPLQEALPIAKQIAEGLEYAHERGIIHRDLKPANIKLTADDQVKILDFGLAKALDTNSASGPVDLSHSPTLTYQATVQGLILGTASYMSPEQAAGKPVDKRSDIWSFGAVLYEMLAGTRLFAGDSAAETLAGVLKGEIDLDSLPVETPPAICRLLQRCLERNPRNRLRDIGDARIALDELSRGDLGKEEVKSSLPAPRRRGMALGLTALGLVVLGVVMGLGVGWWRAPAPTPSRTFHILTRQTGFIHSARFAPDGTTIVYGEARGDKPVALFTTRSDATASRPLDVTGADVVGIAASGEMALLLDRHYTGSWMRVGTLAQAELAGGAPRALLQDVYDADIAPDGSKFAIVRRDGVGFRLEYPIGTVLYRTDGWISSPRVGRDGRRVAFADHERAGDDAGRVAVIETGHEPRRLSSVLNFLQGVAWSADGDAILASYGSSDAGAYVTAFPLDGAPRDVVRAMSAVRLHDVAPNGELLLTDDRMPVSIEGKLAGGPMRVSIGGWADSAIGGISEDGEVVVGTNVAILEGGDYRSFYSRGTNGPLIDVGVGSASGVSPDGRWVFLVQQGKDRNKIRAVPTGPGEARVFDLGDVTPQTGSQDPLSFSADGRRMAFPGRRGGEESRGYVFDLDSAKPPRAVTPAGVHFLRLSPDGRRLVAADAKDLLALYDASSGQEKAIPGVVPGEICVAWSGKSDALYLWDRTIPARFERLDLDSGQRTLALVWKPSGVAEGLYGLFTATADLRFYLMRFRSGVSSLVVSDELGRGRRNPAVEVESK